MATLRPSRGAVPVLHRLRPFTASAFNHTSPAGSFDDLGVERGPLCPRPSCAALPCAFLKEAPGLTSSPRAGKGAPHLPRRCSLPFFSSLPYSCSPLLNISFLSPLAPPIPRSPPILPPSPPNSHSGRGPVKSLFTSFSNTRRQSGLKMSKTRSNTSRGEEGAGRGWRGDGGGQGGKGWCVE